MPGQAMEWITQVGSRQLATQLPASVQDRKPARDDGSPKRFHPHMFRETFAVEMLLAGVPLEQVSILLGHKSVKITEKHYAP
jgi:integrase